MIFKKDKKYSLIGMVVGLMLTVNLHAQTRSTLEIPSRKAYIQEALALIDPPVDTTYFASIKVLARADEIFVSFENPIIYVPQNSTYYYEVLVDLSSEMVSHDSRTNPYEYAASEPVGYYKRTAAQEKEMLMALNAIRKSESSLKAYYETLNGTRYLILPANDYIEVWMIDDYQEVQYQVDRVSKKVTELMKAQLEPEPFFNSDFIEIKR